MHPHPYMYASTAVVRLDAWSADDDACAYEVPQETYQELTL